MKRTIFATLGPDEIAMAIHQYMVRKHGLTSEQGRTEVRSNITTTMVNGEEVAATLVSITAELNIDEPEQVELGGEA